MGGTDLNVNTILVVLSVIIFSVSLAQAALLAVSSIVKKRERREESRRIKEEEEV